MSDKVLTVAEEAIANADAYLSNAVLPTYSELLAAVNSFLRAPSVGSAGPGSVTLVVQEFNMRAAWGLVQRFDATMAGDFRFKG